MLKDWIDYRLHLNGLFSTLDKQAARELLQRLQDAEHASLGPTQDTTDERPVTGVSWDEAKGKWRVTLPVGGKKRGYGRFARYEDAVAQVEGIRAFRKRTGHYPKVGWRAP